MSTGFPRVSDLREERRQNRSFSVFYNLISKMTNHYFCVLSVTQIDPFTMWKKIHKGANTRRQGTVGTILEAGYRSWRETLRPKLYISFKELTLRHRFRFCSMFWAW